ncbi:MAG: hypothetical protein Q9228_000231 [Teloschistes exilis]
MTTISDLVQISPEDLQKPSAESIEDNINAKYANKVGSQTILEFIFSSKCDIVKVVQKIGLCICVYDILAASDGLIGHGTGIVNVNVTLDFFDDIFVPANLLFADSTLYVFQELLSSMVDGYGSVNPCQTHSFLRSNDHEQCWIWSNEGQEYFYDKTEWVRFRVEQEHWTDLAPVAPSERDSAALAERKSPYSITQLIHEKHSSSPTLGDAIDIEDENYWFRGNFIEEPSSVRSWAIVEAHWRFFDLIYHHPIDIRVDDDPGAALQCLSNLVAVGERYGGLDSLGSSIEAFIARHMSSFQTHLYSQGPLLLEMATKLKIAWLYKDMVCLACGDPTRPYNQVCLDYQTKAAWIILEKREELLKMMRDVNRRLLTMQTLKGEADSSRLLIADFREMIIGMVLVNEHGRWVEHAWAYSEDPAFYSLKKACAERDRIVKVAVVQESSEEDVAPCGEISRAVTAIVGPLLVSRLSPRIPFARNEDDGLTCIEAKDGDLPW